MSAESDDQKILDEFEKSYANSQTNPTNIDKKTQTAKIDTLDQSRSK